jgi:porin
MKAFTLRRGITLGLALAFALPAHARGLSAGADYALEHFAVVAGGIDRGSVDTGLLTLSLGYERDGFRFAANALVPHGQSLTGRYAGDFSVISNIDTAAEPRLQEFWGEWDLGTGHLRAGMLAADSEFWGSDQGALFLNSAFGAPSFVSANLPNVAIFPTAALGLRLQQTTATGLLWRMAVLDGDPGDIGSDNRHGLDIHLGNGVLWLGEIARHATGEDGLGEGWKLSGFVHSGRFDDEDGAVVRGNAGLLGLWEGRLAERLGGFVRAGVARGDRSAAPWSLETGLTVAEPFGWRGTAGLALAHVALDDALAGADESSERILELSWSIPLNDVLSVQPDVQYVMDPGGQSALENVWAVGLRVTLNLATP